MKVDAIQFRTLRQAQPLAKTPTPADDGQQVGKTTFAEHLRKVSAGTHARSSGAIAAPTLRENELLSALTANERRYLLRLFSQSSGSGCYDGSCRVDRSTLPGAHLDIKG